MKKTFTMPEAMLCTKSRFGDDEFGWLGSVYSKEVVKDIGKWFKVTVTIEEVDKTWKKRKSTQK